jgi:hypothetical protein
MVDTWQKKIYVLKSAFKKEFEQWKSLPMVKLGNNLEAMIFEHKQGNFRIEMEISNYTIKYIDINIFEKNKKGLRKNSFVYQKSIKFDINKQNNDILHSLRSVMKEIELKELFKK